MKGRGSMDSREQTEETKKQQTENGAAPHKRRVRYKGTHPRNYNEKYKELQPEKYKDTIEKVTKQITKKIDVLQAHYFTDDEIYQHEIALYKITTPTLEEKPEVSKVIRKYNARIVEVNAVFAIVEKNGMSEEITNLYEELRQLDCVLQFVRSGRVAITTSCFERVNEYLADREAKYRQSKHQES